MTSSHSRGARAPSRLAALLGSLLLTCFIAACGINQPAPVKQTYLLQAVAPASPLSATPKAASIKIGSVAVGAPFRGRSLVFREAEFRYQSDFYNEYFIAPSAMLGDAVASWLGSAKVFREVLPTASSASADYILEGFVGALYADVRDRTKPAAVLEIKFLLTDAGSGSVVWNRDFARRVAMSNDSADAFASAMNQALGELLKDLGTELAGARLASPPA
jgi:cholesterol transport system auxiliary component